MTTEYNKLVQLMNLVEFPDMFRVTHAHVGAKRMIVCCLPMHARGFVMIKIDETNYHCECGHYDCTNAGLDEEEVIDETYDALYAHEVAEWLTNKI